MLKSFSILQPFLYLFFFLLVSEFAFSAPKPKLNDIESEKVLAVLYGVRTVFSDADAEEGAKKMEVFKSKMETSVKEDILPTLLYLLVEQSQVKDKLKVTDPKLTKTIKDLETELARISNIKKYVIKHLKTHISLPWNDEFNMDNLKNMGIVYSKSKNSFTFDEEKVKATTNLVVKGVSADMDANSDSSVSGAEFSSFALNLESHFDYAIGILNK